MKSGQHRLTARRGFEKQLFRATSDLDEGAVQALKTQTLEVLEVFWAVDPETPADENEREDERTDHEGIEHFEPLRLSQFTALVFVVDRSPLAPQTIETLGVFGVRDPQTPSAR